MIIRHHLWPLWPLGLRQPQGAQLLQRLLPMCPPPRRGPKEEHPSGTPGVWRQFDFFGPPQKVAAKAAADGNESEYTYTEASEYTYEDVEGEEEEEAVDVEDDESDE
eukprot:symbB.v1.2.014121.t1/scaffold1002.1/size145525/3